MATICAEHERHWIEIELDHPVNPWEHEVAGSITWGANLDRSAPVGEQAVSIINDGIVKRGVSIEATTHLGRTALRIV